MRRSTGLGAALLAVTLASAPPLEAQSPAQSATQAPAAARVPLATIVQRYLAWRGGAAFESMQGVHYSGAAQSADAQHSGEYWVERDGRSREEVDFGGVRTVSVVTPKGSWDVSVGGQITQNAVATRTARQRPVDFADAFLGKDGASLALNGTATSDGHTFSVVRISYGEDDYDAVIDPDTGALVGMRVINGQVAEFVRLGDWRVVDGVRLPFLRVTQSASGTSVLRVASAEVNTPMEAALFTQPQPTRHAVFANGAKSTRWIDFEFYDQTQIFFPVEVDGHPAVAMLDTGASSSVIDRSYAASIGLGAVGASLSVAGATGVAAGVQVIPGSTVKIGDLSLQNMTLVSVDLSSAAKTNGRPLSVLIGGDALAEVAVDIDFARRRLALRDPDSVATPVGMVESPLVAQGGARVTQISINGGPLIDAELDMGDAGGITVFPRYAVAHGLPGSGPVSQWAFNGLGGVETDAIAHVLGVGFGGAVLSDVPASFPPRKELAYPDRAEAVVGMKILSRFHLIVDYPHDRLLAGADPDVGAPFTVDRLGLALTPEGDSLLVLIAAPGSPAAGAGFKKGDRIAALDGQPAAGLARDVRDRLAGQTPGTEVVITLVGGATRAVTLADYY